MKSEIFDNYPVRRLTSSMTGGITRYFTKVTDIRTLIQQIKFFMKNKIRYIIIGGGTNILFPDGVFEGAVIKNSTSMLSFSNGLITADSGVLLQSVVDLSVSRSLSGMEKLSMIPGTVGGAVFGNAGAYGQSVSDHLVSVKAFNGDRILTLEKKECLFEYRDSLFKKSNHILLQISFRPNAGTYSHIKENYDYVTKIRLQKYPPGMCCPGSFFKNVPLDKIPHESVRLIPPEKVKNGRVHVGWLLQSVNAAGLKIGGIEVSKNHCNILSNRKNGKTDDFIAVANELVRRVKKTYGVILDPEVIMLK